MARILVVDDDTSIRETFANHLGETHEVRVAADATRALAEVAAFDPALVITDVRMPGMSGLDLLSRLRAAAPDLDVIVITAHEDMSTAIGAMKAGAYDYLVKPLDLDHVDLVVERCLRDRAVRARVARLSAEAAEPWALDQLVGRDPAMIAAYKRVGQVADATSPVLIRGETGTGKELLARALHFNSVRAAEPFVAVNCAAIPESLLESELFGHAKGAFTGAVARREGLIESAGRGTLFLDEIGDTSPAFQARLLRVLDRGEYQPVGESRVRRSEARIVAATHRDLRALVARGEFREDLYYRLRVVEITVPPLRERRDDVPLLARHFLDRAAVDLGAPPATLSPGASRRLRDHDWPGNVRELRHAIQRAALLARGGVVDVEHLELGGLPGPEPATEPEDDTLDAAVKAQVERVLRKTGGHKRNACRRLGISRPTLDRLIARHGIEVARVTDLDPEGKEV